MEEPKSTYIIGFEEIFIKEDPGNGRCIWCNKAQKFNTAHILSKKIIRKNHPSNVLKRSVCTECNSYFGNKIEDWFYKYSPLGTWANQLNRPANNILSNLKYVPNFLWSDQIKEWIIVHHDKVKDILATQILLNAENRLLTLHYDQSGSKQVNDVFKINLSIREKLINGEFTEYLDHKLPENFSPRIIIYKDKLILTTRTLEDKARLVSKVSAEDENSSDFQLAHINPNILDKLTIQYSWSLQRYFILCAKIGFEFLSQIIGQEFSQHRRFDDFKKGIHKARLDKIIIPFIDGKGYLVNRLTPPGWVGYVKTANSISGFPIMTGQKKNCHSIFIYSMQGYLLFDVKLFAIEPCQLIIAKNCNLNEVYHIEYDITEQSLRFFKLEKNRVIINKNLDFEKALDTIRNDQHLSMVTLRDYSPPSLLKQ
ncbi:hypothetical protein ACUN24_20305 [Pedobacter sp. WC2501]|uniref:hypothetical protein n=1 Tax=Pedobacter sp. WC2501 TaxID=3461400 RepID=UPI00404556FF